jgi:hypothetical protein
MKATIVMIAGKALSLMLLGLAYVILHRAVRNWCR